VPIIDDPREKGMCNLCRAGTEKEKEESKEEENPLLFVLFEKKEEKAARPQIPLHRRELEPEDRGGEKGSKSIATVERGKGPKALIFLTLRKKGTPGGERKRRGRGSPHCGL